MLMVSKSEPVKKLSDRRFSYPFKKKTINTTAAEGQMFLLAWGPQSEK